MDWDKLIEKESTKDYYKKLMDFVQQEYLTKKVFPKKEDIFAAFKFCSLNDLMSYHPSSFFYPYLYLAYPSEMT